MSNRTEENLMRKSYQKEVNKELFIDISCIDLFINIIIQKKKDLYYLNCNQKFFSNTLFKDKNINDIYEIILKKIINDEFEVQFDNYHLTLTMDVENEKINLILFKTFSYLFE